MIHAATNESQVAGVLAHEVAHIAERHAAGQLTKGILANLGLGLLGAFLGNSGGADAAQAAAGLLTNGMFLKFSRDDEREADRVGLQLLRRAGWDGRGMVELFEILQREAQSNPSSVEIFFSSHPAPAGPYRGASRRCRTRARGHARYQSVPIHQGPAAQDAGRSHDATLNKCQIASPPNRVRIFSSTRTTRWTGTRGATRRSSKARREDKPIFLSVGYSTCHWCHVMEHESFEDASVAAMLNRDYVSIKVDREERPDVDRVYMTFVQVTTGAGGWPMSVWLTPTLGAVLRRHLFPTDVAMGAARLHRDPR